MNRSVLVSSMFLAGVIGSFAGCSSDDAGSDSGSGSAADGAAAAPESAATTCDTDGAALRDGPALPVDDSAATAIAYLCSSVTAGIPAYVSVSVGCHEVTLESLSFETVLYDDAGTTVIAAEETTDTDERHCYAQPGAKLTTCPNTVTYTYAAACRDGG